MCGCNIMVYFSDVQNGAGQEETFKILSVTISRYFQLVINLINPKHSYTLNMDPSAV